MSGGLTPYRNKQEKGDTVIDLINHKDIFSSNDELILEKHYCSFP